MKNDRILRIYTDGGCAGNQHNKNFGGWGAILEFAGHTKELCGGEADTTNNRMEMTALLEALKAVKKDGQVIHVFSDSSYLMDCFRKRWYVKWLDNGWKTAAKKPVENQDLWKELLPYLDRHEISFYRVKGHVGLDKSSASDLDKLYSKFTEWNGTEFSYEDFVHVTEKNNISDKLANEGIHKIKQRSVL